MQNNNIFIGIDLSYNSTGITIFNQELQKMEFHRVAYREQANKINHIHNINLNMYSMPTNVITTDICDMSDTYSFEQYEITLKGMVCIKKIGNIINDYLKRYKCEDYYAVHINIEGYIQNTENFTTLSGLIMLQGNLRATLIQILMNQHYKFKMKITSPTTLKKFFCGNGKAEKLEMIHAFYKYYEGKKLINTSINNLEINDVVDSFALVANSVAHHYKKLKFKIRVKKKRSPNQKKNLGTVIHKLSMKDVIKST